ncbi:polymer-forming cytoskeletal protein [Chloroflexus sp.]|uniref:polymer-forming cytoskeletal protein n=1 Tax=Chloroflexus sp. TaxID=1904827 RepID=UPI00298EDFCD|nr:polymer-forming cytoskeletal protein [Chloroflexus sp.]MDW8405332.1 polymer-forming cytoskeletal protein [Chloroflexus sp.]
MKYKWLFACILFALFITPAAPAAAQGPGALIIAANEQYHGHIVTFDQPIVIVGEVDGDVTSWTGSITVQGVVRGDVVSYTGAITIAPGAVVEGNVLSIAGGVKVESQLGLRGIIIGTEPLAGSTIATALIGVLSGQATVRRWLPPGIAGMVGALISTLLCVAVALIWPRRTAGIGRALRAAPLRSAAIGFLSTILLISALPFLVGLLTLSLAGLVLIVPLIALLHVPYAVGLAGVARAIAATWPPGWALKPPLAAALGALVALTPLIVIGAFAPMLAVALGYTLASWGLGAALISRGGALPIWRDGWPASRRLD